MNIPPTVTELLDQLLPRMQAILGDNFVGAYLRGSLAMGDFIPATSDVDVLVATERRMDDETFFALATLHAELASGPNPFGRRLEMAYIDRASLRRFCPGEVHPTLGQGETLAWSEHGTNWILERWTVREHGITLAGSPPQTLIDPVPAAALTAAVRERLPDWADWAWQTDDPDWQLPRSHKAYVIETMCRALYTLAHGELSSKARAVQWALKTLPEPWRTTVVRSQRWRTDATVDLSLIPEVSGFVLWVAERANPHAEDSG